MKNTFPLIIAIVIALAALFATYQYVQKKDAATAAQLRGQQVVAANVDIPAGAEITPQMLYGKEVPAQFIPAQAIQGNDQVKLVIGSKTSVGIKAGQMILWSDLVTENRGGLSSIIPTGEGAFSVSISQGVKSDLIQPSDHIDIIGTFSIPKPSQTTGTIASWRQASDLVNVVLLQNVTVLAVGGNFNGSAAGPGQGGGDLTLALTLPEAQELMFAGQNGQLGAVLRRSGATDVTTPDKLPRVTFDSIDKIIGDLDEQRNYRSIDVQKGGEGSEAVPVKINQ